jgi:hypothetical protein
MSPSRGCTACPSSSGSASWNSRPTEAPQSSGQRFWKLAWRRLSEADLLAPESRLSRCSVAMQRSAPSARRPMWGLPWGSTGARSHRELNLIRRIRNKFAHHFGAISFTTPDITSQCSELWLPRNILDYGEATGPTDPREQYVRAVLLIFHLLWTEMKDNRPELREPRYLPW